VPAVDRGSRGVGSDNSCVIQDAGRCNEGGLVNAGNAIRRVRADRVQIMGFEYRRDPVLVGAHHQLWR
jgi:hypothetical protein